MKTRLITICVLLCFSFACQDNIGAFNAQTDSHSIAGSWIYVEYGFSPGAGYVVREVPAIPPQVIQFGSDFSISTNIEGLDVYKFYRIVEDSTHASIIAFYKEDPGNEPANLISSNHTYYVLLEGNSLKLTHRWCIEGCHALYRISRAEPEG